ncbi:LuxR C-terminal-related transcriptional regulator [Humibacter soli]
MIDRVRDRDARVVSVIAPAGYGKSTLLAEWAATETRDVGWVSLDPTDDDPGALLAVIAAAASRLWPSMAHVLADVQRGGESALGRSAPLLAGVLAAASSHFVLFIDDLQWAGSPDCEDALEVVLSRVPAGSQVVLASRDEPLLLARLRATGAVAEIRVDELVLERAGARTVFSDAGVGSIHDDDLDQIVERCEGWPTGVYLCALITRDGQDATSITGDDRFVADYLYRECVARLPGELQSFLRRTAVLDELSATSCNALLDREDSRAMLGRIESANLFLIGTDRDRGWFRYHTLFRDFLQTELERTEGADAVRELHRRAGVWHQENGAPVVAVEHFLLAGETTRAVQLVTALALTMYQTGRVNTVRRWLAELGDEIVRGHPPLVVLMTWAAALLGELANGTKWIRALNEIDGFGRSDAEREQFESSRSLVLAAMCPKGTEQMGADAAYTLAHEPDQSPWRPQAMHLWGLACLLRDDLHGAREAFEQAVTLATETGRIGPVILSEPELALLALEAGRWKEASVHARRGVAAVDGSHQEGYSSSAMALAVGARTAFHFGDIERGKRLLARGMRARIGGTYLLPIVTLRARLQLAGAHLAIGDRAGANHLVHEMTDILRHRPDVGTLTARIQEFRDSLAEAPAAAGAAPLTPAELRLLPYLQTHLTIAEIGHRLFVSRNTASSQVGSIYRKLGVQSRSGAVERATKLGLLGA